MLFASKETDKKAPLKIEGAFFISDRELFV